MQAARICYIDHISVQSENRCRLSKGRRVHGVTMLPLVPGFIVGHKIVSKVAGKNYH